MRNLIKRLFGYKHLNSSRETYEKLVLSSNCLAGKNSPEFGKRAENEN